MTKTLFTNCFVYNSVSEKFEKLQILVENGVIVRLAEKIAIDNTTIEDLEGSYLIPGLTDAHTHSFEGGLYALSIDMGDVECLDDVFDKLNEADASQKVIFAYNFDENRIREKRFPTMKELDRLLPHTPLLVRRVDGHSCVINRAAAKKIPFPNRLPATFDGLLRREENDLAAHWFHRNVDNETILRAYQKAEEIAIQNGVTTIHTMLGDAEYDYLHFELLLEHLPEFKVEFIPYPQMFDVVKAKGINSARIGGCILADGSFGSRTAALFEPYADDPGTGTLYQTDEFWNTFVDKAHDSNLQVGVHCLGDKAVDQIFRAYKNAQEKSEKDLRHQLIHCELIDDSILSQIAENNIACVMQPMFDKLWGGPEQFYAQALGVERAMKTNRLKTMIDNGIRVVGSSDWYITPIAPLMGIEASVNHHNPDERLSIPEAIKIYTENSAWLIHEENSRGVIKEGYKADFTIIDRDILKPDNLTKIKAKGIIKNGYWLRP